MGYYRITVDFPTKLFLARKEFAVQGLGESEAAIRACKEQGWQATRTFVPLNPVTADTLVAEVKAEIDAQNKIAGGE